MAHRWSTVVLLLALAGGVLAPPALAKSPPRNSGATKGQSAEKAPPKDQPSSKDQPKSSPGTDQNASLQYEPKAGYDAPPRHPGRLAPAQGALMGVHSADSNSLPPNQQGVFKLEQALGRTMDINNHYHGAFDDFAKHGMGKLEQWDVDSGRIPLVGWGCTASDKVASGSLDGIIHATAQKMKAFGHEFFLRYCWEMDGDRRQGEIKGPQKFIAAWQRMYKIFQAEGATNVIWVWTPNAAGFKDGRKYTGGDPPAPYFYPGDEYVDWIAADGYNWGVSKRDQGDRWRQVLEIFDEFMVFARQHPKPIMIGEYGAQEQTQDPAAKPKWMRIAHETFMDKPRTADCPWCGAFKDVAAVVYFDVNYGPHGDWRIQSSQASYEAYREAALDPYFHQLQTVSWPPAANRGHPQSSASSASSPPPGDSGGSGASGPADQSDPADQPDPADEPAPPDPGPSDQPGPSGP
ncbi:MAG TPA: glycosyl hydrolase [Acidimicrobiia bacterium]|nr:glycosyl hydrolase [Acidimicrobiia bacterium]